MVLSLHRKPKKKNTSDMVSLKDEDERWYCMKKCKLIRPKKKASSSSELLMLATTSVWMGCTAKRDDATSGSSV